MPQTKPFLSVRSLSHTYHTNSGETPALRDIHFDLFPGEFAAIVGPSGCGKSTLLELIAGLIPIETGSLLYPACNKTPAIGYMLQKDLLLPHKRMLDNVALPLVLRGESKQAAREKELQEEIRKSEEANRNNQTAVGGFIWPTACRLITGGYGGRDAPCPGASTYHLGVDIGASWGSDIYATKAGTVKVANEGWNYGLGYCVKIQHDDGTSTVYGHMSRVIAVVGQRVAQGQVIGKIGSTGVSTGPHLHYEIRIGGVNGTAVNPLPYLPGYVRYGW